MNTLIIALVTIAALAVIASGIWVATVLITVTFRRRAPRK